MFTGIWRPIWRFSYGVAKQKLKKCLCFRTICRMEAGTASNDANLYFGPLLGLRGNVILFSSWDPINYKKRVVVWFRGGSFQKGGPDIFWTRFIKVVIFTFTVEIIFLLKLCHMFEHIYFLFLHNSKEWG